MVYAFFCYLRWKLSDFQLKKKINLVREKKNVFFSPKFYMTVFFFEEIIDKQINELKQEAGTEERVANLEERKDELTSKVINIEKEAERIEEEKEKVDETEENIKGKKEEVDTILTTLGEEQKDLKKIYKRYISKVKKLNKQVEKMLLVLEKKT